MTQRCDLHSHTTASDGELSPTELVQLAVDSGLAALGVTDHDTVAGIAEASAAAAEAGLALAPGVEVSAEYSPGTMHILGYFVDTENAALLDALEKLRGGRDVRNRIIIEKLNALGVGITMEEVMSVAGEDSVGRPHLAQVILDKGFCNSRQEVFDKYLAKGAAAYFDRIKFEPEESIEIILEAGGVAVLAHPTQLKLDDAELDKMVQELTGYGLKGIEVYYWSHTLGQTAFYKQLADKHDLIITGGSDYHGPGRAETRLGVGAGNLDIPLRLYERLRETAEAIL